jgi:hypothetical protein
MALALLSMDYNHLAAGPSKYIVAIHTQLDLSTPDMSKIIFTT